VSTFKFWLLIFALTIGNGIKDPIEPLGKKKRKRAAKPRSKGRSESRDLRSSEPAAILNPEEGWDDETEPQGTVLEYPTNEEVRRR
jgi:centromere protein C